MKKKFIFLVTAVIMLICFTSCSSSGSEEKVIGEIDLGVTQNQVIEQLGECDDATDYSLNYQDIELFGQYCKKASFGFEDGELNDIFITYPSGADEKEIFKALEKAYGKQEFSFDDNVSFSWHHEKTFIVFSRRTDELETNIMIFYYIDDLNNQEDNK